MEKTILPKFKRNAAEILGAKSRKKTNILASHSAVVDLYGFKNAHPPGGFKYNRILTYLGL